MSKGFVTGAYLAIRMGNFAHEGHGHRTGAGTESGLSTQKTDEILHDALIEEFELCST